MPKESINQVFVVRDKFLAGAGKESTVITAWSWVSLRSEHRLRHGRYKRTIKGLPVQTIFLSKVAGACGGQHGPKTVRNIQRVSN